MTSILRIQNIEITDSSNINVTFTETLTPNLVAANVSILSQTTNVPDSQALSVSVSGNVLYIICQPLTPYAAYFLQFQSTTNNPFISINGNAKISQDNVSNRILITGPLSADNPVLNYLQNFYQNNIYNIRDSSTVISSYMEAIAVNFSRALYDIRQAKNENYLSFTIIDEAHIRGPGPFDRLNEGSAYDIFRVGYGATNSLVSTSFIFPYFPSYPVTLQRQFATETIMPSSNNENGTFNINTLIFNLSNTPVTRVDSITFTLNTINPNYPYNIDGYGYQILNSKYDQDYASSYLLLADNQIKINEVILQDPNFSLDQIFNITIQYEYKQLGIVVDSTTVNAYTTLQSNREVIPPIINVFNLQHAPITDSSNNSPVTGGVTFINPNSNTGAPHPAFLSEIPFSLSAPPYAPGIYSIDYPTGTVYVYGEDSTNDGTGPSPPLATYYYRFTYTSQIDYVYDNDALDIVALPLGNLINSDGTITFKYEQVLIPGTDYVADSHIESIYERVGNKLIALNALATLNSPITNVFQIYNETSGEIYLLDRWTNNNVVYFKYNKPPRILQEIGENATFTSVSNELLGINTTSTNLDGYRIFTIYLANNTIIGSTQDSIASSINTSLTFTNGNVFILELWYNKELDVTTNINRLNSVGQYTVDYINGIIYVAVSNNQSNDIGNISYKMDSIVPNSPHIISVDDIYYRISTLNPKNKQFSYTSFADSSIVPASLDVSDETYLNNTASSPYQVVNGIIGSFVVNAFVPGVTNAVKFTRSIYEYNDLFNSTNPINFSNVSVSNNFNITVSPIIKQSFETVQFDGYNYFITLNENIPYLSPNITYTFSIVRASDSQSLWNNSGTIVPGNPLKLILPGIGSPHVGDSVDVVYSFTIAQLSRVIVDYNKGDFFVDYTYVADEILVSYESGDNVIDFRQNNNLPTGTPYYVSYKAGALRDALLKNFGTLVNVPDLANFDLSLERERYREALQAALSSFIQGPTVGAIKNLVEIITHVAPQVIESAFQVWSLGSNLLNPIGIETTGNFQILPAHFGNGVLINQPGQTITLPVNSNLRLEEGTFETWIYPQWNGIDNDASLIFNITRDGTQINQSKVFIGGSEYHPNIVSGNFTLDKNSNVTGRPNTNKDGVFIYYDDDISGNFQRWYVKVVDGYVALNNHTYKFQISSSGKFYDAQSFGVPSPKNMSIFTGTNKINFTITTPTSSGDYAHGDGFDGYGINEGLTFISDMEHYILDFGLEKNANRLSIYKDVSGYINFRVFDNRKISYSISANISSWQANNPHMIAASWKLNTRNSRDEMHLFIDGLEVPNIIKYGQKLPPFTNEKYRTVDAEYLSPVFYDIVGSDDLITTQGSNSVSSSINFSDYAINIGDTIFILESGFDSNGYVIEHINGQILTLNQLLPITMTNGKYSVNQTSFLVRSDIDVFPNIAVSTIQNGIEVELPGVRALRPDYSIGQDGYFNNILTISNGIYSGDSILIRTLGLNFRDIKSKYYVWSNEAENILMTQLPPPISLNDVDITKVILPNIVIGATNSTLISGIFSSTNLTDGYGLAQPSNSQNGRTIKAIISGTNVDFSVPVEITINGVDRNNHLVITETIIFNDYGTLDFVNAYISINYIQVNVKPINSSKNALAIEVCEKYPITYSEFSGLYPTIRYSYQIGSGTNLSSDGYDNLVTDEYRLFSYNDVGNYIIIQSPAFSDGYGVAGYYSITGISADRHSINIQPTYTSFAVPLPAFTGGIYQVLNTTDYRSGLQNGFFTLESSETPSQAYLLSRGQYKIEYYTYLNAKFAPLNNNLYIGTDYQGENISNSILDQFTLSSIMLTDTRIGEVVAANARSITKDFNSLKAPKSDTNTLVLISFDNLPFINDASFYASTNNDHVHFQSDFAVNDNFGQSMVILDKPILIENAGVLDTRKQATIEFWMSPLFDTANDPNFRFYFDAYGAVVEQVTSISNVAIKLSNPASQILSVTLSSGDQGIDYFAGGKLEIDTQNAIQEEWFSMSDSQVLVSQPILQVITVKIAGDLTGTDYFNGGTVGTDRKTIYLGKQLPISHVQLIITYQSTNNNNTKINTQVIRLNKKLPAQNSVVLVKYIPSGLQGDRISLFKDKYGFINFAINASGIEYVIKAETRWARNTWHRVKASYQVNGGIGTDEMRLFLDGYEYTDVFVGPEMIPGQFPAISGSSAIGDGYNFISSITFKDPINNLFVGSDYTKSNPIFALLDNLRISNISRPIYAPYGEPIDVNFSSNLSTVFPVTQDLYTTYLMDFNEEIALTTNFATLVDRANGAFEFTVNIFDSFDIVGSSATVRQILENLINILKPANSQVYIKYIT